MFGKNETDTEVMVVFNIGNEHYGLLCFANGTVEIKQCDMNVRHEGTIADMSLNGWSNNYTYNA